jgi:hypothetical protein
MIYHWLELFQIHLVAQHLDHRAPQVHKVLRVLREMSVQQVLRVLRAMSVQQVLRVLRAMSV